MITNNLTATAQYLLNQLPRIAAYLVDSDWLDIDDPREHEPDWHQWGVLEHSRRVSQAMANEAPIFCLAWEAPFISDLKAEVVEHKSKWDLLLIACVVHDLGKWAGRTVKSGGSHSFKGHEAVSEHLIRHDPYVRRVLLQVKLRSEQLDYIARVAGTHYELGKLRRLAQERGEFDLTFLKSDHFRQGCKLLAAQYPDYLREIGLIFLADSLAKVEFRAGLESSEKIETQIAKQGLSKKLMQAVSQVPLNIALCRAYFKWLIDHQ